MFIMEAQVTVIIIRNNIGDLCSILGKTIGLLLMLFTKVWIHLFSHQVNSMGH